MLQFNQSSLTRPFITKPSPSYKRLPFGAIVVGTFLAVVPALIIVSIRNPVGSVRGTSTTLTPAEIISVTNAARQTAGLTPVHPAPQLMNAAQSKAKAMLAANSWSHNTPSETPWEFISSTGYQYSIAGENLARNYDSAAAVVEAWLNSPSHRDNLLNPNYTDIGVAVETGNFPDKPDSVLVVQYFATKYETGNQNTDPADFSFTPLLSAPQITALPINKLIIGFIIIVITFSLGVWAKKIHHRHQQDKQFPSISHWHK